jgi:hypothetical protein
LAQLYIKKYQESSFKKNKNFLNKKNISIMKKQSFILFTSISKEEMAHLTKEVKETIAFGLVEPPYRKIFTAAELWDIQRQSKARAPRRYL